MTGTSSGFNSGFVPSLNHHSTVKNNLDNLIRGENIRTNVTKTTTAY